MESHLSVVVRDRGDATVLAVSGELDMATSAQLVETLNRVASARLDRVAPARQRRLILDLARLNFIDVSGLRVLLGARERAREAGSELLLINVGPGIRRLIGLTGASELLEIIE